jgi:phosphopantetheinyl transferase
MAETRKKNNFVAGKYIVDTQTNPIENTDALVPSSLIFRPFLSQPWRQRETGVWCRRIEPPHAYDFDKLSHAILTDREKLIWYQMSKRGSRRIEWLLGRAAGKDAVRQWAGENRNLTLNYLDLEIIATTSGKPQVNCPSLADTGVMLDISLSHTQSYILAAVAPPKHQIGIDLEFIGHVNMEDVKSMAFTEAELDLLPNPSCELSLLSFWCAKEAAAKATGIGIQGHPQQWQITKYSPEAQTIQVTHDNQVFEVKLWYGNAEVVAICQI